jgi:hypothetical protein
MKPHVAVSLRVPMPDQTPPGGNSKYVTDQTDFRLQHIMGTSRSEGRHTFIRWDTKWDTNAIKLWLNPLSTKGWYWNNGCQLQMAREAAEIPFDQRSLAQRWAIREATAAETLPEGLCSVEPDVERMGQRDLLPQYLRREGDGRISAKDWTVWLFIAMTQPEQEPEVVDWFWWSACQIFVGDGTFTQAMRERPMPTLEGIHYIPRRLQTPAAGFSVNDLVEHFVKCGLRLLDATMLFRDFASHYLAHVSPAPEPVWSKVSPPPTLESRCSVKERVKLKRKEYVDTHTEPRPNKAQTEPRASELAPIRTTNSQTASLPPIVSQPMLRQTPASPEPGDISMGSGSAAE